MATNNAINLNQAGIAIYDGAGTFSATTTTQHAVLVGGTSNTIVNKTLTDGQILIGSTGVDPVAANITAGSGIAITNGAGSITVSSTGLGITWTVVTGATQAMSVNSGYIANNAGTVIFTLPSTAAVGSVIAVTGINNNTGWQIAQNAGQTVHFGTLSTTTGAGGSLASTKTRDTIFLLCVVANTDFNVIDSIGNITVV